MCIITNQAMLDVERTKTGQLQLWKVVKANNEIGIWRESYRTGELHVGVNMAERLETGNGMFHSVGPGQFHCFFTRCSTRKYRKHHRKQVGSEYAPTKIIKVYANRRNIIDAGIDRDAPVKIDCISVSKMTIKSLKHQR